MKDSTPNSPKLRKLYELSELSHNFKTKLACWSNSWWPFETETFI